MSLTLITALVLEVAVLSGLENRLTGTRITPFGVLAVPYTIVVLLAFTLGPLLNFVPLDTGSLTVWMLGLFLLWVMGYLLARIVLGGEVLRGIARRFRAQFQGEAFSTKMSMLLAMLSIPVLILGVFVSVRAVGGWSGITSPEFKAAHAHGLHADAQAVHATGPIRRDQFGRHRVGVALHGDLGARCQRHGAIVVVTQEAEGASADERLGLPGKEVVVATREGELAPTFRRNLIDRGNVQTLNQPFTGVRVN